MSVLIWFVLCWSLCNGSWSVFISTSSSSNIGENVVPFWCRLSHSSIVSDNTIDEIQVKFRRNKNTGWKEILVANTTGTYLTNMGTNLNEYSIHDDGLRCLVYPYMSYFFCHVVVSITLDRCPNDPNLHNTFRCQLSNSTATFLGPEMSSISSIKGPPPRNMSTPVILSGQAKSWNRNKEVFDVGDILQIQCIGEIQSVNGNPSQDIRWCKKVSGKFISMSLQNQPLTTLISKSDNGCVLKQESKIFYHIESYDTDLEIMCESGYKADRKECGINSANAKLHIKLATEANRWNDPYILLYDAAGFIDPQNISRHGTERTIHLLCMASMLRFEQSKTINWCVKKQESDSWTTLVVQDGEIKAIANETGEIIKFSRTTYHVTAYDKVVHFLCELSTSSICGSGLRFKNVSAHMIGEEASQQTTIATIADEISCSSMATVTDDNNCSTAGVAVLAVLLGVIFIVVAFLVIATCRRGQLTLFGFVFKIERQHPKMAKDVGKISRSTTTSYSVSKGKTPYELDARDKLKPDRKITNGEKLECATNRPVSVYENEVLRNDLKEENMTKTTDSELRQYEDLGIMEEQQEYEELKC